MGGRLHPEWWQVCPGISGRVGPEYAQKVYPYLRAFGKYQKRYELQILKI